MVEMKIIIRRHAISHYGEFQEFYWRISYAGKTIIWTKHWSRVLDWLSTKDCKCLDIDHSNDCPKWERLL